MPADSVLSRSVVTFRPTLPDLDGATAREILAWAVDEFGSGVAVACSMQDTVLLDLALQVKPPTTRSAARPVEWDAARAAVKINPIVDWTDADVARYSVARNLIVNPLRSCGYDSIGCAPCTNPGRGRDGRWPGTGKVECGLHVAAGTVER